MMRKALGRGLDALIDGGGDALARGITDTPGGYQDNANALVMVAPERIAASRLQPRQYFDPEKIAELAAAIKSQGIIEPLVVRRATAGDTEYELIAGERRLRAARAAGLELVPVIVKELDDRAALEMSLVENILRENLNAIEEGSAFTRLNREFDLSHEEIAARIGKSRPYVTNLIRLTELPPEIIEMIGNGELTAGQVRPLIAMESAEEQMAAAQKILEGRISARGAERIGSSKRTIRGGQGARFDLRNRGGDANLDALAESIQRAMRRKVSIVKRRGKKPGRIELQYYNDEDLTVLAELLMTSSRAA